jgi:hypothetical protein
MSLATVWATLKITKPMIIVALKEQVIQHLNNTLEHNQDIKPTTAEYNEMAWDMVMHYIEKRHAQSLGTASITSSHPSMVPERIQWTEQPLAPKTELSAWPGPAYLPPAPTT